MSSTGSEVRAVLLDADNVRVTTIPLDDAMSGTTPFVAEPPRNTPAGLPGWRRAVTVFLASQTISLFGSMLVQCAIMWHLTLTTRSGSVMALAAVFGFLPQAVVSVFGGVWADRLNRAANPPDHPCRVRPE